MEGLEFIRCFVSRTDREPNRIAHEQIKVWDVEDSVNMKKQKKDDSYMVLNSGTGNTIKSEISMNSGSSSETDRSM